MEIGIDSFAAVNNRNHLSNEKANVQAINDLLERIVFSEKSGLDIFGIGEHYREEFLDSAPSVILAAAASKTKKIRLTSAVTVLGAADPVRVFQNFSTLDIISNGRAEIIAGRGSFSEAFPLFGIDFNDYDDIFEEKLNLLLNIRDNETVNWSGRFRPKLENQKIYPRSVQKKLPIWLGVGGTPQSFIRAGKLGLPLMIAIIGGEVRRFEPFVDLYRKAYLSSGHDIESMKVGIHCLGYIANSKEEAIKDFYPGYKEVFNRIGKERGWPPVTSDRFKEQISSKGALIVGDPDEAIEKINDHSKSLGGISRLTFQMNVAALSHKKLLNSIDLIGNKIKPFFK